MGTAFLTETRSPQRVLEAAFPDASVRSWVGAAQSFPFLLVYGVPGYPPKEQEEPRVFYPAITLDISLRMCGSLCSVSKEA